MSTALAALALTAGGGTAVADDSDRQHELATALAAGDVATLQAAAAFPFYVYGLWFDTAPCQRFGGAHYTLVAADEFAALVQCLVDLQPHLRGDQASTVLYGAGSPLTVRVQTDHGRTRMRAFMGAPPRMLEGDAAPIDGTVMAARTGRYTIPVPPKLRRRIDASPSRLALADLRVCFGLDGKVDTVTVLSVGPDAPEYGALSVKAIRRWKVAPFVVGGAPVRACGTVITAYPGSRLGPDQRVHDPEYPPPPAPPTPSP